MAWHPTGPGIFHRGGSWRPSSSRPCRSTGTSLRLLAVARYFTERGDRVRFLTGSRFAEVVEATGAQHVPLPPEADFDDRQDWDQTFPERVGLTGREGDRLRRGARLRAPRPRPARRAHGACTRDEPADALLTDPAFAGGAFLLGHPLGERPPIVVCGVVPLMIASRDTAPYGMGLTPLRGPLGRLRNALLSAARRSHRVPPAERIARRGQPRSCTGGRCRSRSLTGHGTPRRSRSSPSPSSSTPAPTRPRACTSSARSRPPARRRRCRRGGTSIDGSRPVVHVTQGTIANRDYRQIIAPTLEALADDDLLVVVSTGGRPLDTLPPLPANARAATYLPYDALLPRTDVYVTNGGYGGVQYALRYGVPIVTSSGQEDKPEVAGRIAWSGVGRRLKTETPSPAAVGAAVRCGAPRPQLPGQRSTHRREHGPRRRHAPPRRTRRRAHIPRPHHP